LLIECAANALADGSTHDRELYVSRTVPAAEVVDVFHPFVVVRQTVGGDADDLNAPFLEIFGATSNFSKFGGTDRCEIAWVTEEHSLQGLNSWSVKHMKLCNTYPGIADPFMELDWTGSSFSLKIWGDATKS
jgi:hypothetical protein